ncbi:hypothetical protein ACFV6E_08905 [Streptomyces sp. NPDC059785]|uniref:hypothetical protein n=1 Tax=unclassified Streptomyces TaxID=2593676 RepID=UPI0036618FBD
MLAENLEALARTLAGLAARHHFDVVDHSLFTEWATARLTGYTDVVVLDKLFTPPPGEGATRYHAVRAHRRLAAHGQLVLDIEGRLGRLSGLPLADPEVRVALVDDAAYTGDTLVGVLNGLARSGITVERVLVAVATERAQKLLAARTDAVAEVFFPGPVRGDVIHARDVYPWLPHSGRSAKASGTLAPPRRIAPLLHRDGAWLTHPALAASPALRTLAASAVDRLHGHLGREPLVADVALLGGHVAVPLRDVGDVPNTLPLRQLLGGFAVTD